ncbi:MAG: 23S rRNA (adenine(2503)-C(2))-methyltransferase RlmN [Alphaproteobacteria bacterium]|nr:23S rRNA (adenine(2503)-C(2))-methyltransferase RlmN [Alphaproteobacteria bacterium]
MNKPHIFEIPYEKFVNTLKKEKLPAFRAGQIWQWAFEKGIANPEEMTNLGKSLQQQLLSIVDFSLPEVMTEQKAADGTVKWLFKLQDGHEVETVFIPEAHRGTLCVSSQVGCTLNCRFCHTGTQGLSRNLEAWEIVAQVWLAKKRLGEWEKDAKERRVVGNLVFMGMGEPLFNWDNVKNACKMLMAEKAFAFGSRKITISTSGMVENIPNIASELGVNLAISLHAPDDETRTRIMPINKKWPLEKLMGALRAFPLKEHRRITWEYVMLKDVNDTPEHAEALIKLIKGIPSFVNLIPFNEWPGSPFKCSTSERIQAFKKIIEKSNISVAARTPRGEDILAACGQLRGETSKFNTVSLDYPTVVAQYGNERQKAKVQIESCEDL